jgi:hypothetical protein
MSRAGRDGGSESEDAFAEQPTDVGPGSTVAGLALRSRPAGPLRSGRPVAPPRGTDRGHGARQRGLVALGMGGIEMAPRAVRRTAGWKPGRARTDAQIGSRPLRSSRRWRASSTHCRCSEPTSCQRSSRQPGVVFTAVPSPTDMTRVPRQRRTKRIARGRLRPSADHAAEPPRERPRRCAPYRGPRRRA